MVVRHSGTRVSGATVWTSVVMISRERSRVSITTAARTWRSMSLLAPIACCVVMQRRLGDAIGKVVSEPSPFGRSLME